jgi:molybdate transport system substrate-binding protein
MSRKWIPLLLAAGVLAAACGTNDEDTVLVLAASSLTDAFQEMEVAYERANPGIDIELSFSGSSALRLQIDQGAPADVVAVANDKVMIQLAGEGHVTNSIVFATNRLVIASPIEGSESVTGPESLTDPNLLVGLCALQVPCGEYASHALELAGIEPSVDTYENDVRSLTTKLAIGELDVGVVYETDVASRPADIIVIAPLDGAEVRYPIAPLTDAPHAEEAAAFVEFVLSAEGRAILDAAGFGSP